MKKPKLIISDIDDTLVLKHHPISELTKSTIKKLQSGGIRFAMCSGRPIFQLREYVENWQMDDPDFFVGLNGCHIYDSASNKDHHFNLLKKEWLREIAELMEPFDANISMYIDTKQVFSKSDDYYLSSKARTKYPCKVVADIDELFQQDNAKIMFRIRREQMAEVEKHVSEHPSDKYHGFKTGPMTFEFNHIDCNKSYGLVKICELMKISTEDAWAFGDTSNDNQMLRAARLGICLKNGSQDTKDIADVITEYPCDQDGLANFLIKELLS